MSSEVTTQNLAVDDVQEEQEPTPRRDFRSRCVSAGEERPEQRQMSPTGCQLRQQTKQEPGKGAAREARLWRKPTEGNRERK